MSLSKQIAVTSTLGLIAATVSAQGLPMMGGTSPEPREPEVQNPLEATPRVRTDVYYPPEVSVMGIVRDFHEKSVAGGHPDMENRPEHGFGLYVNNVAPTLGEDGKPVFTGGGSKIITPWYDNQGRAICYRMYRPSAGDVVGALGQSDPGGITSAESFSQWYQDTPGVNLSALLPITFHRQDDGTYVFDDTLDPEYVERGGFFPIDDELFGNSAGTPDHNFHFTFELKMRFEYRADDDQFFRFIGDDDVWVFINNELVIDLGGVHWAMDQHVELSRLNLVDGEEYPIHFFFAERHRTESNFRIETNIPLNTAGLPAVTKAYD